jgi:hypothetical protein
MVWQLDAAAMRRRRKKRMFNRGRICPYAPPIFMYALLQGRAPMATSASLPLGMAKTSMS